MTRAFVIRPFGTKKDSAGTAFDFEAVHDTLIGPALEAVELSGSTTGEIIDAGNIREDMFSLILEADVAICDITVLNANVFYELGIRHALRKRRTLLIKQAGSADSPPFDLLTDRYHVYDPADPKALGKLTEAIKATVVSDRPTDSPIFKMLPDLPEADPASVQVVPPDFGEEVGRARAATSKGWLRLLAEDVRGRRFERPGLHLVGARQWDLRDYDGARRTLEAIRHIRSGDVAADLSLANIYERLHRERKEPELLALSDQAIARVLGSDGVVLDDEVEARALRGRNLKTRWRAPLADLASLDERRAAAMNTSLRECFDAYREAFRRNLNHYWSGLAALQMGEIFLDLSAAGDEWKATFDDDAAADGYRKQVAQHVVALRHIVAASVDAALARLPENHKDRIWARVSQVDVLFLTEPSDQRVVTRYRDTIPADNPFAWDAVRGQLELFAALGVRAARAQAVIAEVDKKVAPPPRDLPLHVVVFAGHRVDAPGRPEPRFPGDRTERAKRLIHDMVAKLVSPDVEMLGLASAAHGGDLLFHEACAELGIRSLPCLPMPVDKFSSQMFHDVDDWRSRFLMLCERTRQAKGRVLELSDQGGLPRWLEGTSVDPWHRGNRWVIHMALAAGARWITLVALWDGKTEGEAAGGTAQVVRLARETGVIDVKIIDARELLA